MHIFHKTIDFFLFSLPCPAIVYNRRTLFPLDHVFTATGRLSEVSLRPFGAPPFRQGRLCVAVHRNDKRKFEALHSSEGGVFYGIQKN